MSDMDPGSYYDDLGEGEWERLDRDPVTRLEFENTTDYLHRHLPQSGHVLDIGGAAGRYACWLAERGFEVTLVDLSAEQVRLAREKASERGFDDRITIEQGDVRDLRFETDRFDAVCCLGGPLSHVVDPDERATAMAELRRVGLRLGHRPVRHPPGHHEVQPRRRSRATRSARRGRRLHRERVAAYSTGEGWAECHFFRAEEFEAELEAVGFTVEQLVGLEGIANRMNSELAAGSDEAVESVCDVVKLLREDRTMVDFSEHILAVTRA